MDIKKLIDKLLRDGNKQKYFALGVMVVVGGLGLVTLYQTQAATYAVSVEAESGSPTGGASAVDSPGASNNKAVRFALGSTPAGAPSTTAKGNFAERACTRTYALDGMQAGDGGNPDGNGDRLRSILGAAQQGDCITVAPGKYKLAGNIEFNTPNITLKGLGATREDVWFEHTTQNRAIFLVQAGGVHLYNFTHRVMATERSSLGQSGEGNIWVQGGHSGFRMQDVLAWGSRDAAIFLYGVHNFELNRVESRDSKSDAYHVSNGSSNGKWYDSISRNSGDDGIGIVGYGGAGDGTPHHHTVVRHSVFGQTWGRGFGLIHSNNVSFYGPTLVEESCGAGIIMAREPQYGTGGVSAIHINGELRFRRVNKCDMDHGAIHIHNPDNGAPIEDIKFEGPIIAVDTGKLRSSMPSSQVRVYGSGKIQAEIYNMKLYGVGPGTIISLGLSGDSSVLHPGWGNGTPYENPEPPFPLP